MPYGITQCYLPPGRGDVPALTPAEAGTRLSDPGGMQGNSLSQILVYTHCASVHQAAKLVAALLRVARVTAGLAESNGCLPLGL